MLSHLIAKPQITDIHPIQASGPERRQVPRPQGIAHRQQCLRRQFAPPMALQGKIQRGLPCRTGMSERMRLYIYRSCSHDPDYREYQFRSMKRTTL